MKNCFPGSFSFTLICMYISYDDKNNIKSINKIITENN